MNFNGFLSKIGIVYSGEEMFYSYIDIQFLADIDESKFYKVEDKLLQWLSKKYGDPQESENEKKTENKEGYRKQHLLRWNFKNDCYIIFHSFLWHQERFDKDGYINLPLMEIVYINDPIVEEIIWADKRKLLK